MSRIWGWDHHHVFRYDATYHCTDPEIEHVITMGWWHGPALVVIGWIPFAAFGFTLHVFGFGYIGALLALTSICFFAANFAAYEYFHFCMHKPRGRFFETTHVFRKLNAHHLLHHRYMGLYNFNTILPIADWLLGTLCTKADKPFDQATGPSLISVQPQTK